MSRIIDSSVHIGVSAYGESQSAGQCVKLMDKFGIGLAIVSSFTPPDLSFEAANLVIEKAIRENGKRLKGAVRIDPRFSESPRMLKKFLKRSSFVCCYLNPFEQSFKVNSSLSEPLFEIAEELHSPVIIESGYPIVSLPLQVAEVAREFRKVKIVMTHSGQLLASGQSESDAIYAMSENVNLYCDTSQLILSGIDGFIGQLVQKGFGKRIIFASNSPRGDHSVELLRVQKADISESAKVAILFENARELFGI